MARSDGREKLLLQMYDQMFSDINRHVLVIWQSVAVVVGAFALLALVEKNVISLDIGAAIIITICAWLFANLYDSAYWYNRNLVIIANIEREFLKESDLNDIHYYFGKHRPDNKMFTHLRIQFWLGLMLSGIVIVFHFYHRVWPGIGQPWNSFDFERTLPYLAAVVSVYFLWKIKSHRTASYNEFVKNSPGKEVDTGAIEYGEGHGFPRIKD